MKISDWFSIVAVLLVQGKGLPGELSRCASIKGYEHPTCVEWTYGVATVSLIPPPWDKYIGLDCSRTYHNRQTCCKVKVDKEIVKPTQWWPDNCRNVDGSAIKTKIP
ncbi:hypothetical protein MJO28_016715 [Puccinia striiformis f. sp. tritici]|uniref:Uncharacterized protein n=2 Tax=Puccinia striiformis f. sp. tritici TaxID=168172 RepID=A0ACC0DQ33_9BASI|nr:hypothetical protein MJO29_015939 [Puccinia striiformis f. sp. tritici]KAI7935834.1 hypothetical protein MJO28_016705 [Puccinia striiformis f. sp. tritici]KAI7935844.1 hypothetical protein MJO28_016715 [Puccinia striiformis f. sp. tritici]